MTWHDGLTMAVEFVRYVTWPLVIVYTIRRIGPSLLNVLRGRQVEWQGFGVCASVRALEQQQATAAAESSVVKPPVVAPLPDRAALQSLQQSIQSLIANLPPQEREAALLRGLTLARLAGKHEFVYNRIFGSQIAGLKRLDELGSVTIDQAREFFDADAKQFPALEKYGFDNWLGFIKEAGSHGLADAVTRFVEQMPPPTTDQVQLARQFGARERSQRVDSLERTL